MPSSICIGLTVVTGRKEGKSLTLMDIAGAAPIERAVTRGTVGRDLIDKPSIRELSMYFNKSNSKPV